MDESRFGAIELDQTEESVVHHIHIVGFDALGDEGLSAQVFDLLGAVHLLEDEVGHRGDAHIAPYLAVVVVLSQHQL